MLNLSLHINLWNNLSGRNLKWSEFEWLGKSEQVQNLNGMGLILAESEYNAIPDEKVILSSSISAASEKTEKRIDRIISFQHRDPRSSIYIQSSW